VLAIAADLARLVRALHGDCLHAVREKRGT
jgi:hypothetical protein